MRTASKLIRLLLSAVLPLSLMTITPGCSELPPGMDVFGSGSLSDDPNDACRQERATFAKSNDFFTANVLQSAGTAALLGAEAPLNSSFTSFASMNVSSIIQNILTNAGQNLVHSYADYVQQQAGNNPEQAAQQMNSDLTVEGQARDQTIANFEALRDCRFAQAATLKQEAREGTITRAAAEQGLEDQRTKFDQEIALANKWGINMETRDEQFQQAAATLEPSGGTAPSRSDRHTRHRVVVAATETMPDKREALISTVSQAKAESQTTFNMASDDQGFILSMFARYA